MSRKLEELPLFLQSTVLFPYAQVQLHIFEDRYRQMVRDCVEDERPFGIVLARSTDDDGGEEPCLVGTTVRIVKVQNFDDGQMNIHVVGERRFRIRKLDETQPYLVGLVEPVIEMEIEPGPRGDALALKAREDFLLWMQLLLGRPDFNVQVRFPDDSVALSFTLANMLPIEEAEKQLLLETTDTLDRLRRLIPHLENQLVSAPENLTRLGPDEVEGWISRN